MTGRARAERGAANLGPWRVDVPMVATDKAGNPRPWTINDRPHWTRRRTWAQLIKNDVAWQVKATGIGPRDHVTVQLHYAPGDNRRRDVDNLVITSKAAVDGIVVARVVRDDCPEFVTHLMPVINPGKGERALWLEITPGRPS